jgi:hypothetical protein
MKVEDTKLHAPLQLRHHADEGVLRIQSDATSNAGGEATVAVVPSKTDGASSPLIHAGAPPLLSALAAVAAVSDTVRVRLSAALRPILFTPFFPSTHDDGVRGFSLAMPRRKE